ncbi:MAG: 4-hydroxy-tetrahydrodipicolinate reductase, partial [Flavobacteriaceae bacterium]|nr:4-hydroxy-tetrahydrodipicolinate reductase [Flavobacteriaceae bacterium]
MKIALLGYGRMGKMIEGIALNRGHEIPIIVDTDQE